MSCTACPLHEDALTVCVRARGAERPQVLIVGQNPGKEEDLAGQAFIGKSGRLLDAMLADAGFDLAEVRVTYAVRCATDGLREPVPDEIKACAPHLFDEIQAVRPEVIVAMGATAVRALIGPRAVAGIRGQSFPLAPGWKHGCAVFVTYSPAAVLHTPMLRATVVSDLRRVRDRHLPQTTIEFGEGEPLRVGAVLAYDIETYDEQGKITDQPTQLAVATDYGVKVFTDDAMRHAFTRIRKLGERGIEIVSHNGWHFDDALTGVTTWTDTRALAYLLDETQPQGLESLCVKYLGVRGWKEDAGAPLGSHELKEYNARDAVYTLRLFHKLRELLGERVKLLDHIIRPARFALTAASRRGVWIDPDEVVRHKTMTQARLETCLVAVLREVEACGFPLDAFDIALKTKIKHVSFNPRSHDHVGAVLRHLGYKLQQTRDGKACVDKEALTYIDHPFALAMLEYREVDKRMSTYILKYEAITQTGDGRAHPTYKLTTVKTGRSSASNPNTQNLDRELKTIKAAPPGKVLTSADYAAVEFRMGAFIAGEQTIIEHFRRDPQWDPHTWFAAQLYAVAESEIGKKDQSRQLAKSANFSQVFMGDGHTIQSYAAREMGLSFTLGQANATHLAWHRAFPGWKPYYARTEQLLRKQGYVETVTGMRCNFGDASLLNRQSFAEAVRTLVNAQIQGFCADLAKIALGAAHRAGLPLVDFVHDDLKFEFEGLEQAKQAEPVIRWCMIDEPLRILREVFGVVPTVPLEIEITHQENRQVPSTRQAA